MTALPPYAHWLGVTVDMAQADGPLFTLPYAPNVMGRPGFLHGGAIAGLLEIAAIGTVLIAVEDETPRPRVKPVTVTVDFMRGGRDHPTSARARITRLGARIANVEVHAWQDSPDKPIAAARMTLTVYR